MAPWGYLFSLPALPAQGFLAAAAWTAVLTEALAGCLGWAGLMVQLAGAGFTFDCHLILLNRSSVA